MTEIIQETGYGLLPRQIMRDKNLSLQAKAIYSYLVSFAGNTGKAFPSVNLIIAELGISRDTFYKYMKELEDKGAIRIEQERESGSGKFAKNVYYLNNEIIPPCPKLPDTDLPDTDLPDTDLPDTDLPDTTFQDTNSNSINSNSINSNSINNNVPAEAEDELHIKKRNNLSAKNKSKAKERYLEDSTEYKAAAYLRKKILEFNPKCKVPADTVKALQSWADTIRLTLERDGRTIEELREVVKYIFQEPQGEFWRPNVQSPTGLRRNWDTIYGQMMQAKNTKSAKPKVKKTTFNSMQGREWDFGELARLENERLKRTLSEMEGETV